MADDENKLEEVAEYFFRSNNTYSLEFDILTNDRGQPGLIVRNMGSSGMSDIEIATSGFEIVQTSQKIDEIKMSYRMQGASFDPDVCSDS